MITFPIMPRYNKIKSGRCPRSKKIQLQAVLKGCCQKPIKKEPLLIGTECFDCTYFTYPK